MKTITITFKGDIEVRRQDIVVYDQEGNQVNTAELDVPTIIDNLNNGTYKLNFLESYAHGFGGSEEYLFEESED
jgi:methionine-rich copper-binding protein CopC